MDEKLYKHRRQQSSNAFSDVTIIVVYGDYDLIRMMI